MGGPNSAVVLPRVTRPWKSGSKQRDMAAKLWTLITLKPEQLEPDTRLRKFIPLVISTGIYTEAGKYAIFIALRGSVTLTSLIMHAGKYVLI
jgi:hypothetical protein